MPFSFCFVVVVVVLCFSHMIVEATKSTKVTRPRVTSGRPKKDGTKRKVSYSGDTTDNDKFSILKTGAEKLSEFVKYEATVFQKAFKTTVDLLSVKHVSFLQILGKWKIYQDVEIEKGALLSYPVSIELMEDGTVTSKYDNKVHNSTFKFVERQWPKKCSIEFEILSYKNDDDVEPVPLLYKGYFKRSIMNTRVVFMKGRLYQTSGKAFWKQTRRVGKFKAVKRRYA